LSPARRHGVPLVMDFIDEWSRRAVGPDRRFPRNLLAARLEGRCVEASARILCNTPRMSLHFQERTGLPASRFPVLMNGWEPGDFPDSAPCHARPETTLVRSGQGPLRLVFAGSLYGAYCPLTFLRGWGLAVARGSLPADALQAVFYGAHERRAKGAVLSALREAGLEGRASFPGFLQRRDLIRELLRADLLLFSLPDLPGSDSWVPLRTTELLATGKPLLAEVPEGDARDLLQGVGCEAVFRTGDEEAAARAVSDLYSALTGAGQRVERDWDRLHEYSWEQLAARLAAVLREAAGG